MDIFIYFKGKGENFKLCYHIQHNCNIMENFTNIGQTS